MKLCPHCGQMLPLSAFSPDASKRAGVKSWCKGCVADSKLKQARLKPYRPLRQRPEPTPSPAQTCRCIGGSLLHEDEGDIRCLRCGKHPNERNGSAANTDFLPRGEFDTVKPMSTHKQGRRRHRRPAPRPQGVQSL